MREGTIAQHPVARKLTKSSAKPKVQKLRSFPGDAAACPPACSMGGGKRERVIEEKSGPASMAALDLRKIPLFQDFSASELESIKTSLRERTFEKGEVIVAEGNICERIFIVLKGRVKLYRTSSEGREQTLEVLDPCNTCACNPGSWTWQCPMTAEAATPCRILYLSRDDYNRLVEKNPHFLHALNRVFAERVIRLSSLIEEVSLKDVKKRLVKFLLDMLAAKQARPGANQVLFIPFTREDLARRIGAVRETVARQLHQLKKMGLIDLESHQIIIRDKEGLAKLLA